MMRFLLSVCLLAVISLAGGVTWPDISGAAQAPQLELLGEIKAGLRVPTRIDVDALGNLYVADARAQKIVKFDQFGQQLLVIDQEKASGAGLAVSPAGDRIYAAVSDKVAVFDGAGELLGYLGTGAGEFAAAGSIVLDRTGTIYVADLGRGLVRCYQPDGSAAGQFGNVSFVANSFLAVHPQTEAIYLSDSIVHSQNGLQPKLSIYDFRAVLQQQLPAATAFGSTPVLFFGGIAFDDQGRFYLTDVEGKTIRVLDESGTWLTTFDRNGELIRPGAMAFDPLTKRLFVVQADAKIDVYGIDGAQNPVAVNQAPAAPVPVAPIGGSEVSVARPELSFNNAIDPDTTDQLSYRVRVFDSEQKLIASLTAAEQAIRTSVQLEHELQENDLYHWQVQAFDGQAESAWSELQSFYVNAVQEAPTTPLLSSPLAGNRLTSTGLLKWFSASDADPFDTLTYLLEVATDADFNNIVHKTESESTELSLTSWSALIQPGQTFHWRITAIDNHGLQAVSTDDGRFLYQASFLQVTANMPGARAYLGGNHSYAGQFIGKTPLELRDLPAGRYQLVVERGGFEPFYQPIDIQLDAPTQIGVELRPARRPNEVTFEPLKVAGKRVRTGSTLAPLLADFNLDGIEDLLLAHADGSLHSHPGYLRKAHKPGSKVRHIRFSAEKFLALPQMSGGTPLLVDWNNDYHQDLLIGGVDGSVLLFLNQGDYRFTDEPIWLTSVAGSAVPAVADIDADGDKDLVVGSENGELVLFSNLGSDEQPQLAEPKPLVTFAEAAAPSFVDWDGDGKRELLIASEGQLYQAMYSAGALNDLLLLPKLDVQIARVFAHDLDYVNGKELLVGTVDGELLMGHSKKNKRLYVADFYPALTEKLQQIQQFVAADAADQLHPLTALFRLAEKQKTGRLAKQLELLIAELPADSAAAICAAELVKILSF